MSSTSKPCITDKYAYRSPEDGSRYIISLTDTVISMVKNGENYEIVTIFNKVNMLLQVDTDKS